MNNYVNVTFISVSAKRVSGLKVYFFDTAQIPNLSVLNKFEIKQQNKLRFHVLETMHDVFVLTCGSGRLGRDRRQICLRHVERSRGGVALLTF